MRRRERTERSEKLDLGYIKADDKISSAFIIYSIYSTVTLLARFLGLSTSHSLCKAP